jgi:AbrB family looped-hinge helix DNA binding protein
METVTLDRFGRVLIPKLLRQQLRLKPNSQLEMRVLDGEITLRPSVVGEVVERNGVYVWTGTDMLDKSLDELIAEERE